MVNIRSASTGDIALIKSILAQYILETELVEETIEQFIVAEVEGRVVGCACLDTARDMVELRSIAVLPAWKQKGIGRSMCEIMEQRAAAVAGKLYVRTTAKGFFGKMGFKALDNSQKPVLWQDCAKCDKLNICMQVPMVLELR
ncbi:MAG: GNAT family N-acetyltransferase [ANME-2 cluster archaeon]|nr:GNAT family N-acetyltransferase [ANME-2 cluster archaeon]